MTGRAALLLCLTLPGLGGCLAGKAKGDDAKKTEALTAPLDFICTIGNLTQSDDGTTLGLKVELTKCQTPAGEPAVAALPSGPKTLGTDVKALAFSAAHGAAKAVTRLMFLQPNLIHATFTDGRIGMTIKGTGSYDAATGTLAFDTGAGDVTLDASTDQPK